MTDPYSDPFTNPARGMGRRLVVAWTLVLVPIGYGIYVTIKSVYPLFGG